jgi:hypothetical protein
MSLHVRQTETHEVYFCTENMQGSFALKRQIDKKGFYAEVLLDVLKTSGTQVEVDFGEFTKWKNAISFAALYFFDHYKEKTGLKIKILNLHDMDVDTKQIVVFYVVVQALYQALDMHCDLAFNDVGDFIIPK